MNDRQLEILELVRSRGRLGSASWMEEVQEAEAQPLVTAELIKPVRKQGSKREKESK